MERKRRAKAAGVIVSFAVPLLLIALYFWCALSVDRTRFAAEHISRPVRNVLGAFSGLLPFSLMELCYTLLGLWAIIFIVRSIVRIIRRPRKLLTAASRLGVLALVGLYILSGSLWLWSIEYRAPTFSQRENFAVDGVTVEDLGDAAEYFLDFAASRADKVSRDENGLFAENMDGYLGKYVDIYSNLEKRFPSLSAPSRRPKRMLLYSEIMSRMGFTGVYFCFTGESNLNVRQPAAFIPFTAAHELAHQKGVSSEQECNFLGAAAGMTSGITEYEYSCSLAGSLYLMNALCRADPDRWRELRKKITAPMRADLDANDAYWRVKESTVTQVSEKAYDTYLKANGQPLGINSYGACVDLLVEFYLEEWKSSEAARWLS